MSNDEAKKLNNNDKETQVKNCYGKSKKESEQA